MIPVFVKVTFDIDYSQAVSSENKALLKANKLPMEDAEIEQFAKRNLAYRFQDAIKCKDSSHNMFVEVKRSFDASSRFEKELKTLRKQRGLAEDDPSEDAEIERYSSLQALRACCAQHASNPEWADFFIRMAEACGYELTPRYKEEEAEA